MKGTRKNCEGYFDLTAFYALKEMFNNNRNRTFKVYCPKCNRWERITVERECIEGTIICRRCGEKYTYKLENRKNTVKGE